MLAEDTVLNLFDSYWFQYGIFTSKPLPPVLEPDSNPSLNLITTLMRKSHSDQNLISDSSESPKSVLNIPHLQTILSGKEVESFQDSAVPRKQEMRVDISNVYNLHEYIFKAHEKDRSIRRKTRRKSSSKSMSELEIEELKGFMDLGFVFSDEEKDDSRLVSIIPGLKKLGKYMNMNVEESGEEYSSVSRPYLSEAWESMEDQKRILKIPLMDWRIPAFGNDMELKDHLRVWAHTVASTVV